jgi:hypothetical protein
MATIERINRVSCFRSKAKVRLNTVTLGDRLQSVTGDVGANAWLWQKAAMLWAGHCA